MSYPQYIFHFHRFHPCLTAAHLPISTRFNPSSPRNPLSPPRMLLSTTSLKKQFPSSRSSLLAAFFLSQTSSWGITALIEDFEDNTVGYTLHDFSSETLGSVLTAISVIVPASDLPQQADYISRVAYADAPNTLSSPRGLSYFGMEDIDATNTHRYMSAVALQWIGIDVSSYGTNYEFSSYFGEGDDSTRQDWDSNDELGVYASLDGGAFTQIFGI